MSKVRKSQSWYRSWPRISKASPSTSVTQENISGGTVRSGRAPDLSRFEHSKDGETYSTASRGRSGSSASRGPENRMHKTDEDGKPAEEDNSTANAPDHHGNAAEGEAPDATNNDEPLAESSTSAATPDAHAPSTGWLGWWPGIPTVGTQRGSETKPTSVEKEGSEAAPPQTSTPAAQTTQPDGPSVEGQRSTSWFGLWSAANTPTQKNTGPGEPTLEAEQANPTSEDVAMPDVEQPAQQQQQQQQQQKPGPAPKAGSTWAFWSRDSPKDKGYVSQDESGEIAIMGEGSEAHPQPMTEGEMPPPNDIKNKKGEQGGGMLTWRRTNKRNRPQSMDNEVPSPFPSGASTPQAQPPQQQPATMPAPAQAKTESSNKSTTESETATKGQKNLLLPSFSSTYQMKQSPSILKQISQLVLRSQDPPVNHVFRLKDPPKIRKAISIGVHGLFPATYLRPMIGQPTGTSLRFASLGAEAIRRWAENHGSPDCDIEKVALEGEGKINERVENLWKLMLNWTEHIRQADLILFSCHSQGVPVSIMLLEKLIDLGIVTKAKIGVCAMAGVSLGPFPEYKSGILMGSAAELWDFGKPESANSQRFEAALKRVLNYGSRITFIGSIDDQLSAVYSPANHPYIYRAVFIDGRIHAPDFISHLVGFALKLRNLGVTEHGLIRELSVPLAGSLYSGDGHSRLYYDDQVYDLAISHALETTTAPGHGQKSKENQHPECEIRRHGGAVPSGQQGPNQPSAQQPNPYVLPWIMRGLLEEEFVKTELSQEAQELLRQFDDWRPANKALKDVKYRLEAVRSKL
ncbi:hypothetical protein GMORB2_3156 [Geosmithia morbida]|uniref:YMC020W-like alpha/beta hydrolase domain-containing protein n=1 Tax=Geosmithia morbida TaxID=1094350 RepID=A0A9P4YQT8_9HYPO|nr:uncharacterized protein GMORB2_3156 [Geosmithia morbida]KAF4120355.1 hypothetical protein GMORB2_3156 [Geosmithia morbida]